MLVNVKVITYNTSYHASHYMCQLWRESFQNCRHYRVNNKDHWWTHERTDRQTKSNIYPTPTHHYQHQIPYGRIRYLASYMAWYAPRYHTSFTTYCISHNTACTVYPKKYAHGFVVLCFVVVMQSFIVNSHEVFIHIHQGCFAGTGAIVRLPQCQWSKPDGYGKISQCITTTKHSKAKTVCIFLGIYCISICKTIFINIGQ